MTVIIQIANESLGDINQRKLVDTIKYTLEQIDRVGIDLTLRITDDAELAELNEKFMRKEGPTDVLSFPSGEEDYLGDIAISYSRADEQASQGGHPVLEEMQLLAIHGVLHLVGYDHDTDENKASMWQIQTDILDSLGISARPQDDD